MLQRIQSLFLLVSAGALFATFFVPVAFYSSVNNINATFTNYGWVNEKNIIIQPYPLYIGVGIIMAIILTTLFMYKNRKRQITFCRISYLLLLVQFALYFFLPDGITKHSSDPGSVGQGTSFFLPLVSIGFIFLAEYFIRKDEKLVRSADRLR